MDKKTKTVLLIAAAVVAAYMGYRWWQNRKSGGAGLGTNLNSLAPALVAGSSGPASGLNYYAGTTNVTFTEPVAQSSSNTVRSNSEGNRIWPVTAGSR